MVRRSPTSGHGVDINYNESSVKRLQFWRCLTRILKSTHKTWVIYLPYLFVVSLAIGDVFITAQYGLVKGKFQKSLLNQNLSQFWDSLTFGVLWYVLYALLQTTFAQTQPFVGMVNRFYTSRAMQRAYLGAKGNVLYKMSRLDARISTADQRMTQDADLWSQRWGEVFSKTVDCLSTLLYYAVWAWLDRGYIGPVALLAFYVVLFLVCRFLMNSLARMVFRNENLEGIFRAHHVRLRENAEAITFYDGHEAEHAVVSGALKGVIGARWSIWWRSWVLQMLALMLALKICGCSEIALYISRDFPWSVVLCLPGWLSVCRPITICLDLPSGKCLESPEPLALARARWLGSDVGIPSPTGAVTFVLSLLPLWFLFYFPVTSFLLYTTHIRQPFLLLGGGLPQRGSPDSLPEFRGSHTKAARLRPLIRECTWLSPDAHRVLAAYFGCYPLWRTGASGFPPEAFRGLDIWTGRSLGVRALPAISGGGGWLCKSPCAATRCYHLVGVPPHYATTAGVSFAHGCSDIRAVSSTSLAFVLFSRYFVPSLHDTPYIPHQLTSFFADLAAYFLMGYFVFLTDAFHGLDPGQIAEKINQCASANS
ncbi:putative ABC transporter transmembrane region 2 [Paratrimastix pyriformis]|uniref:ABC transporter transmembrane region 2 n=1 Tax=Paratrimastix pyriformis TaxID=342808 RepID=A0ABQ8U8C5_9EUKA|nr:putative ABC transporter transmembrane region 2 [Paratrimastix pyriformis]